MKFKFITFFIAWIVLLESAIAQPVAITSVFESNDMELKFIKEEERQEKVSMNEMGQVGGNINSAVTVTANNQTTTGSTLQFDNLPKIISEVVSSFEGSFEIKNQQKKQNEELCGQKLNEMKQLVESQLKRSVYKVECSEPEFQRFDGQKMQFTSKATITFF